MANFAVDERRLAKPAVRKQSSLKPLARELQTVRGQGRPSQMGQKWSGKLPNARSRRLEEHCSMTSENERDRLEGDLLS